jgi:hypothetical protein
MTPKFVSRSFTVIGSSILVFGMVVGMSTSTNAETVKVMDQASTDGSFVLAQTNGMERRQDRRDTRQDCRHQNGLVGRTSATANSRDARISLVAALPRTRHVDVWRFATARRSGQLVSGSTWR